MSRSLVNKQGGKITKVPNGPLIKKKGKFKGSTLKNGGSTPVRKLKKAQVGKSISAADSVLKYSRLAQKQIDTLQNPKTSDKTYNEVYRRLRGSTMPQEKKWMDIATGRKTIPKQRNGSKTPAWQRSEGKNPEGGLNAKGVASYRRANPGSKLKTAVTTKPSKLKPGSKSAKRRKSFCARMSGMKKRLTSAKTANDPNSRINKSLRKWNC